MNQISIRILLLLSLFLTACEEQSDTEKGFACIKEQERLQGEGAYTGDCIKKYWMPDREANPYLK